MDSPPVETKRLDGEEPNGEEPSRGRFQKKNGTAQASIFQ